MYCRNCGNKIEENASACGICGTTVMDISVESVDNWKNSYFDGGFWGLFGVTLLSTFVSIISLGFAWPAMYCYRLRWVYRHTCVGGYRLKFNGRGAQLFGKYILWTFLSIITIGVFTLWLPIKYKKWEIKHVEIASRVMTK